MVLKTQPMVQGYKPMSQVLKGGFMVHRPCIGHVTTTQAQEMKYLPHEYNIDTITRFDALGPGIMALTMVKGLCDQDLKNIFRASYAPPLHFTLTFLIMTMLLAFKAIGIMNGLFARIFTSSYIVHKQIKRLRFQFLIIKSSYLDLV